MMIKKTINHKTPMIKFKRTTVLCCKALYDHTVCAHMSKTLANVLTYPIETVRLWSLCPPNLKTHPQTNLHTNAHTSTIRSLYTGFSTYLPYCIFNNIATYQVFQSMLPICGNLYVASLLTCFLISCYKVPYNYFLKNRVIGNNASLKTFCSNMFGLRAMAASLSEEVPDLILKLTLKENILSIFPLLQPFHASIVVALTTSAIMCPIEFLKTRIMCGKMLVLTRQSIVLKLLISVLNMLIFQSSYEFLYATIVHI